MRLELLLLENDILNLGGEHIDTTDDEHVVAAPEDTIHTDEGTATGTLVVMERREVVGAVAEQRHALLGEVGEGQFSEGTLRERFAGVGVEDFRIEIILIEVGAALAFTLIAHAGTGYFREAIDIIGLYAHSLFELHTHLLRPGFSAEGPNLELKLLPWPLTLVHGLAEEHGVGRCAAEHRSPEVVHQRNLLLGITRRHGNDTCADVGCPVMGAEATREETIAIAHLEDIILRGPIGRKGPGDSLRPHSDILSGMEHYDRFSRGARRGMDTHNLAHRHGSESEGIIVTEVKFVGKR